MIVVVSGPQPAAVNCDPPNARMEYASEGAAMAARSVMNTPHLGHAQLEAVVGVLEVGMAPFAAAYGAVTASRQRLSPDQLSQAELDLREAMQSNAGSTALREKVADAARQKTCRLLVCAASVPAAPAGQVPVSAVLELAVEQFRLEVVKPGRSEYALHIQARARLLRRSDGAVLLDRPYQYTSGPALFIDWARYDGLEGVAQTAYQSLAERIAEDIFQPAAEPPLLIGPGYKHSGALSVRPWIQFVSLVQDNVASVEVYAGRAAQPMPFEVPGSDSGESSEVQSDTEWALDGLENDRNSVVQLVSCLAAVPMGIWEQTAGAVLKTSRNRTEKLVQALDTVPDRRHFQSDLADEVARRLRSQVINPVRRPEEALRFALATPFETSGAASAQPPASPNSNLALQIQVVNAQLVGKRGSSRSRALCVEIHATIIRSSDGQELYSRPFRYRSSPKRLKDWAASDARLFRQELGACSRQAAEVLTVELIRRGFVTQGRGSSAPGLLRSDVWN
jgi:hypothetical protein